MGQKSCRRGTAILAAMGLSLGLLGATPVRADDHPPVVPVGQAFSVASEVARIANGGEPGAVCQGRFVLRGSCEVHASDARDLQVAVYTEGVPTGNGTEVSYEIEFTAYDLDNDNVVLATRQCSGTSPAPSPQYSVEHQLVAGWQCYDAFFTSPRRPINAMIVIDTNGPGTVWAGSVN